MTTLVGEALAVILIGSTHYVDVGKNDDAIIYYPSDTVAHMTLPDGPTWKGAMEIREDGYYVDWEGGPEGYWQISYQPGKFVYISPEGKPAGTVTRIVPGNPENF